MNGSVVINETYFDENVLAVIYLLQQKHYCKRYEETLLKVVESFILDEDLPPDEQWEAVRILSELRRDLRALSATEREEPEEAPE